MPHGLAPVDRLYARHGTAHLVIERPEQRRLSSCPVDDIRGWAKNVPRMIAETFSQLERDVTDFPPTLDIHWTYGKLPVLDTLNENLGQAIGNILHDNLVETFEKRGYVPKVVLEHIFANEAVVAALVSQDSSLADSMFRGLDQQWRSGADFVRDIYLYGLRLLALFVCCEIRLSFVYELLVRSKQGHYGDVPLVHRWSTRADFNNVDLKATRLHYLLEHQYIFRVHTFRPGQVAGLPVRMDLDINLAVPIFVAADSPETALIGEGGFGRVYRVRVDPLYHSFDGDRAKLYALKVLKQYLVPNEDGLQHEEQLLRGFHATNLLGLLYGHARGVQEIHRTRRLQEVQGTPRPHDFGARTLFAGFHHDLKPSNILIFSDNSGNEIWKISDFDTARVKLVRRSTLGFDKEEIRGTTTR